MLYRLIRPAFFAFSPEISHAVVGAGLRLAVRTPGVPAWMSRRHTVADPALEMRVWGLLFPNPVGLAAGFDKDAHYLRSAPLLGFGFTEVGTVTPRPQPGNPKPRVFRIRRSGALINRMGFNNAGADRVAARFEAAARHGSLPVPVGINLGKNRDTPLLEAATDYLAGLEQLHPWADYLVVNVSSPNTPGLRDLQDPDLLEALLAEIVPRAQSLCEQQGRSPVPVLVKLSPDEDPGLLPRLVRAARRAGASGFVACNTTRSREGLPPRWQKEVGGLSGRPLAAASTRLIRQLYALSEGRLPIIGSGGIFGPGDAYEKIRAGASLVQIYTGLIYEGPGLPRRICLGLLERLRSDGFDSLAEAVGADHGMI